VKRNMSRIILITLFLISLPLIFSCDTVNKDPYIIINVDFTPPFAPTVDDAHKLYAKFYTSSDWTSPFLEVNSSTQQILVPRLSIGSIPIYFEVVYDTNGDGVIGSGDHYMGWDRVTNRSNPLTAVVLPNTDTMILDIALNNGTTLP
jgi:hypothetical protein